MYKFYYNPNVPIHTLSQVMSLQDKMNFCNDIAIPQYRASGDKTVNKNILANLFRLNWLTDNLRCKPMVKPIVATHSGNSIWQTVVGDTRLAALEILKNTHTRVVLHSVDIPYHPDCPTVSLHVTYSNQWFVGWNQVWVIFLIKKYFQLRSLKSVIRESKADSVVRIRNIYRSTLCSINQTISACFRGPANVS